MRHLLVPAVCAVTLSSASAAGLLVAEGGMGGALQILDHEVHVTLTGAVAVTEVTQVFLNTENRQVEALYTFPVPKGASVSGFSMWIDGREMVGEVLEKERARQIYETYKQKNVDPGLLEQVDYKTFEMRIFPIQPGAEQRVRITYYQELDLDHDRATYVYPLATATRGGVDSRAHRKLSLDLDATSPVPLVSLDSPSHADDFVVVERAPGYYQASLEQGGGDLQRDFVLTYQIERPRTGLDVLATQPDGEDGYFMLTLTAGPELADVREGADFVFVLDISGSMEDEGKMDISRRCVDAFMDALQPADRFEVLTFNVDQNQVFGELTAASPERTEQARQFLSRQVAKGGTDLQPALELAYRYASPERTLNVVILSDGITNQWNRQSILQLIEGAQGDSRIFCVGVGNETDRGLLQQIAGDAGGLAAFLSTQDDLVRQAGAFRRKIVHPVASDVRLTFSGGGVHDLEPAAIDSLFHGSPIRVYGRYSAPGQVEVSARALVKGEEVVWSQVVELPRRADDFPEIERMWAWKRIDRLLGEADRRGDRESVRSEIVALGEGYSIASEFTSFLVLENDAEYQRWKIQRRNASRVQRDQRRLTALRQELATLRDKSLDRLTPADGERVVAAPASSAPAPVSASRTPAPGAAPQQVQQQTGQRSGSRPLLGGGFGGGAIDPVTGGLALGAVSAILAARRRRRNGEEGDEDA